MLWWIAAAFCAFFVKGLCGFLYAVWGIFTADALKLSLILVPFMFTGLFSGMLLCRRINETMIRRIVVVLLILSGVALIPGNF